MQRSTVDDDFDSLPSLGAMAVQAMHHAMPCYDQTVHAMHYAMPCYEHTVHAML